MSGVQVDVMEIGRANDCVDERATENDGSRFGAISNIVSPLKCRISMLRRGEGVFMNCHWVCLEIATYSHLVKGLSML
jgi:hypothetical protein